MALTASKPINVGRRDPDESLKSGGRLRFLASYFRPL